jgi:hypothetical protein
MHGEKNREKGSESTCARKEAELRKKRIKKKVEEARNNVV